MSLGYVCEGPQWSVNRPLRARPSVVCVGGLQPPVGDGQPPPPSGNCAVFVGDRLLAKLLPILVII
jgi:hypothetical protein